MEYNKLSDFILPAEIFADTEIFVELNVLVVVVNVKLLVPANELPSMNRICSFDCWLSYR